jgi:predicted nucleotidyltransferase
MGSIIGRLELASECPIIGRARIWERWAVDVTSPTSLDLLVPNMGIIIPTMGKSLAKGTTLSVSIADALFTQTQQRVLSVLFGTATRSRYASEIIGHAQIGRGAVQRELARLEASGLITSERIGNQKHYRANEKSPVFGPLRDLVLRTSGLADVLHAALAPLAPKMIAAFVFGSIARGEDSASSDVDLLVISDTLTFADLFGELDEASRTLGREVNPQVYSRQALTTLRREKNSFVERVLEQPKIWIHGDEDALSTR